MPDKDLYILCDVLYCCRAVRALLKFGADPNLPDEFSNIYLVAREKGLNALHGIKSSLHNKYFISSVMCMRLCAVLGLSFTRTTANNTD